MTDVNKVMEVFLKIEKELDLFNREFNGFHFWNYTRVDLYNIILKELNGRGEAFPRDNIRLSRALTIAKGCLINPQYKLKRRYLLRLMQHIILLQEKLSRFGKRVRVRDDSKQIYHG